MEKEIKNKIKEEVVKELNKIEDDLIAIAPATIMDITIEKTLKEIEKK